MTRNALLLLVSVAAGFIVGIAWGKATRSKLGESVKTSVDGGKVTVTIDAWQAGREGLKSALTGQI